MRRSTAGGAARGLARGWGAACFLVLPTLLLGSWITPADATGITLEQARDSFYSTIDSTEQAAGGDWRVQDSSATLGCAVNFGQTGRAYSALRISSTVDPDALAEVTSLWTSLGYDLERTSIGPATQLVATGDGGEQLIFRTSERAMTLQGESECS